MIISGNTTLPDISCGEHNVNVFAADEVGKTVASQAIFFSL
jgi:hypothetical protein